MHRSHVHVFLLLLSCLFHIEFFWLRMVFMLIYFWIWVIKNISLSCFDNINVINIKFPLIIQVFVMLTSSLNFILIHIKLQISTQACYHLRIVRIMTMQRRHLRYQTRFIFILKILTQAFILCRLVIIAHLTDLIKLLQVDFIKLLKNCFFEI